MLVLKHCNDPELNETNFCARLNHSTHCLKYSPNDVGIILFTNEKTFTVITPKNPQNDRLYAHPSTKKKDVATKRLCTQCNVRLLMTSVGESQVVDIIPVWYLRITESRLLRSINRNVMLLQQFLLSVFVRSRASSSSFSRTVPWRTGRLRQSAFPLTLPNVELFQNSFKTDWAVNL